MKYRIKCIKCQRLIGIAEKKLSVLCPSCELDNFLNKRYKK